MNRRPSQNPKDVQLLSAYLDGQLALAEMARIEKRIASDSSVREMLELLRQTRHLLKLLPARKAPRNFTLSQKPAQQFNLPSFTWVARYASVTAAILLAASFLITGVQQPGIQLSAKAAPEMASEQALQAPAAPSAADSTKKEPPNIIFWGGPPLREGAFGKGGGGAEGPGIGGGAPAVAMPQVLEAPVEEAIPQVAPETPVVEPAPLPTEIPAIPLAGSEPVLGIGLSETRGQADVIAALPEPEKQAGLNIDWALVRWVLAGLFLATGIPAWLIRRK